jgi:hypothetical protein
MAGAGLSFKRVNRLRDKLLASHARAVVAALRDVGAAELPDILLFPVMGDGRQRWNSYEHVASVSWRGRSQDFYIRTATAPFDIVPLRPLDPRRWGLWFSIGPGFDRGCRAMAAADVLLIQAEGPAMPSLAAQVRAILKPWEPQLYESFDRPATKGWDRYCAAAELP